MIKVLIDYLDSLQLKRINKFLKKFNFEIVIDVGAHKGDFIKYSLQYLRPKKIYASEPHKDIYNFLKKNTKMTKFRYQTLLLEKITIKTLYILIILKKHLLYQKEQYFQNLS